MALPDLNTHLEFTIVGLDDAQLRKAVDILMDVNTCFARIGGEGEIRTTKRGEEALTARLLGLEERP